MGKKGVKLDKLACTGLLEEGTGKSEMAGAYFGIAAPGQNGSRGECGRGREDPENTEMEYFRDSLYSLCFRRKCWV